MEEICIVEVPPLQVVGITRTGTYQMIPDLLMTIFEFISDRGIAIAGMPAFICHETCVEAVKEGQEKGTAVVEVVWPISGKVKDSGEIRSYLLPGGTMVRAVHKGPYETCESTYQAVFAWIETHQLTIAGPIREIYPNDPRMVPPEEIRTEILVPVQ